MAKKLKALADAADGRNDLNQLAKTIRDSAQQIWLAGLGAFSKAQDEGGKVFETLVKEGLSIQRRTRAATEERIGAVGEKMSRAAGDLSKQATQSWDRLEQVFEDRVSRALTRLGVPTSGEIAELLARVDALNETVQALTGAAPRRAVRRTGAAKSPQPRARAAASPESRAGAAASPQPRSRAATSSESRTRETASSESRSRAAAPSESRSGTAKPRTRAAKSPARATGRAAKTAAADRG